MIACVMNAFVMIVCVMNIFVMNVFVMNVFVMNVFVMTAFVRWKAGVYVGQSLRVFSMWFSV